jgi:hypothetical protein
VRWHGRICLSRCWHFVLIRCGIRSDDFDRLIIGWTDTNLTRQQFFYRVLLGP